MLNLKAENTLPAPIALDGKGKARGPGAGIDPQFGLLGFTAVPIMQDNGKRLLPEY